MRERFLPHWGLASQWWLWCWWHQPCHFSACLFFTVHATHPHKHYQRLHPPLQATHQRRRYVLCVCVCKRGEEWKKVPFNSSTRIPSPGWEQRRKERGKKKLSIPMCRGQYKHSPPVFRQLQSDSVPFRLLLTDWQRERERERERETERQRDRERGGRERQRQRQRQREREREMSVFQYLCWLRKLCFPSDSLSNISPVCFLQLPPTVASCFRRVGLIVLGWSPLFLHRKTVTP